MLHGKSPRKARGRGYLRLKCEDELGPKSHFVTMRMSMGEESRGPVKHDFAQSVCLGQIGVFFVWSRVFFLNKHIP